MKSASLAFLAAILSQQRFSMYGPSIFGGPDESDWSQKTAYKPIPRNDEIHIRSAQDKRARRAAKLRKLEGGK